MPPSAIDMYVPSAGFVHVVPAGGGDVGDGGRHGRVDAQGPPRGGGRSPAEADQDAGGAGPHQVQGRGVAGGAAHDHRDVQFVDELLEVQRFVVLGDVLGRDGGAADDKDVDAGGHHGLVVFLGALRGQGAGNGDAGGTDFGQAAR